jgi:hypothetical protein
MKLFDKFKAWRAGGGRSTSYREGGLLEPRAADRRTAEILAEIRKSEPETPDAERVERAHWFAQYERMHGSIPAFGSPFVPSQIISSTDRQALADCGEYGHDKGVCGNASCTPKPTADELRKGLESRSYLFEQLRQTPERPKDPIVCAWKSREAELEEAHAKLDALGIQRAADGAAYSLWGRIERLRRDGAPCESPAQHAAEQLIGIVRTAMAQAERLIKGEEDADDRSQTRRDLPATLAVIDRALQRRAEHEIVLNKALASHATLIHYPQHWDTAAYPTLESAVREALSWAGCSACKDPVAYGIDAPQRLADPLNEAIRLLSSISISRPVRLYDEGLADAAVALLPKLRAHYLASRAKGGAS